MLRLWIPQHLAMHKLIVNKTNYEKKDAAMKAVVCTKYGSLEVIK